MRADLTKIKQLREAKGLTQAQIASRLGYRSPVGYCRVETGQRRLRIEHLGVLAELLGVSVPELLTTETVTADITNG